MTARTAAYPSQMPLLALPQIGTIAPYVNGATLALPVPVVADGRAASVTMDTLIDEIVRRSIRHARLMLKEGSHHWPVTRLALRKILADLESRAPDHPSLPKLRTFVVLNDRKWVREQQ
jgi:hypothetical protein